MHILPTYRQATKELVRSKALEYAVKRLTSSRYSSPIVTDRQFDFTAAKAIELIGTITDFPDSSHLIERASQSIELQRERIGRRKASELTALLLSGPEPTNDVNVLIRLGLRPENIWLLEKDKQIFDIAVSSLSTAQLSVHLYNSTLDEFFEVVPQKFDLVYFDACSTFVDGKPSPIFTLKQLFVAQRLSPLSVLVTNFSWPTLSVEKQAEWAQQLACWFAPRNQPVASGVENDEQFQLFYAGKDGGAYLNHITRNLEAYYSNFISTFITELAGELVPTLRARALLAMHRHLISSPEVAKQAVDDALGLTTPTAVQARREPSGSAHLSPSIFQSGWTQFLVKDLPGSSSMRRLFHEDAYKGVTLADAVSAITVIRDTGLWGNVQIKAIGNELLKTLQNFRWFDSPDTPWYRLFCDTPQPHLVVDMSVGQIGYPYHTNQLKSKRFSYVAKSNRMMTDVFVLDQCRYFYDLVPAIPLLSSGLPLAHQLILRIYMDRLRHHVGQNSDLFFSTSVSGFSRKGGYIYNLPRRIKIEGDYSESQNNSGPK